MNRGFLEKPFEPAQIRQRKGRNGVLDYVEGHSVVQRLNDALEGRWSFEVVQHDVREDEVVVLGRLTADGVVKMSRAADRSGDRGGPRARSRRLTRPAAARCEGVRRGRSQDRGAPVLRRDRGGVAAADDEQLRDGDARVCRPGESATGVRHAHEDQAPELHRYWTGRDRAANVRRTLADNQAQPTKSDEPGHRGRGRR
jgi:hypothetical protein